MQRAAQLSESSFGVLIETAPTLGGILFALQQFAGINGVLYFSSLTFRDAGITNSMSASAFVAMANLLGRLSIFIFLCDAKI